MEPIEPSQPQPKIVWKPKPAQSKNPIPDPNSSGLQLSDRTSIPIDIHSTPILVPKESAPTSPTTPPQLSPQPHHLDPIPKPDPNKTDTFLWNPVTIPPTPIHTLSPPTQVDFASDDDSSHPLLIIHLLNIVLTIVSLFLIRFWTTFSMACPLHPNWVAQVFWCESSSTTLLSDGWCFPYGLNYSAETQKILEEVFWSIEHGNLLTFVLSKYDPWLKVFFWK